MFNSNANPGRPIDADVTIVGAGTTGLACALVLAQRGYQVVILERRLDSHTPAGLRELAAATTLLADASNLPAEQKLSAFKRVRKVRNRYWATSERNVLLDEHSQKYLKELGVDESVLPKLQSIEFCGVPGGPSFVTELETRDIDAEANGLHARRMIYQRNWSSLAPLSMLQNLLRSAVDRHPQITLRFDQEAAALEVNDDVVAVTMAVAAMTKSRFLLIADGGGRQSLQHSLNLHRSVDHAEVVNFGVFESDPDIALFGRSTESVFSYNALLNDGWIGIFCTGKTFSIAVNSIFPDGSPAPTAEERLAEFGVQRARLVEPPMAIRVEVAQLSQFHHEQILFAGDAAVSGNPRFGLGVQFGLVWAQALARAVDKGLLSKQSSTALTGYALEGARIAKERRQYELPWLAMLDSTVEDEGNFIDAAMSAAVFESVLDFEVCLFPSGANRQIRFRTVMDFSGFAASPLEPLGDVFTQVGYAELEADLLWTFTDAGGDARIEATRPVSFQMGTERIIISEGTLRVVRVADGWTLTLSRARARLISQPDSATETASRSESDLAISHLCLHVPDHFINRLMLRLPHRLAELGLLRDAGTSLHITLRENQTFSWGPLQVRFSNASKLQMNLKRQPSGSLVMSLIMLEGRMEPLAMTRFSVDSRLSSARWLASLSKLTRGTLDRVFDSWVSLIGRQISRVDFKLKSDGSALATFGSGIGVSMYLTANDVQNLQDQLLKSAVLAELMPQYQQGIVGLQTVT